MDKMHEKANKLFTNFRKMKNIREKDDHQAKHVENTRKDTLSKQLSFSTCYYCPKVFKCAKFLLKHMFRRHAEELILLHQKIITSSKSGVDDNTRMVRELFSFLEGEFGYLKKGLRDIEHTVTQDKVSSAVALGTSINMEKHLDDRAQSDILSEKSKHSENQFEINEVKDLKLQFLETECSVKNLTEKFEELVLLVKDVLLKQDAQKELTFNEDKILKQQEEEFVRLKNVLLSELQAMVLNHLQENNMHHRELFSNLKLEFERHESLIRLNSEKISSPNYLKEIKEEFEKQLLCIMKDTETFKVKNRKSRSKHTISSNINSKKTKQQCKIDPVPARDAKKSSNVINVASNLISEKLLSFNICPGVKKISLIEYDKKMELINSEKKLLCKRYKNFFQIYSDINSYADSEALLKLKNKKAKKIRFSEPCNYGEASNNTDHINKHYQSKVTSTEHKIMPEFVASDPGGCGDNSFIAQTEAFSKNKSESFACHSNKTFVVQNAIDAVKHDCENITSQSFSASSFQTNVTVLNDSIASELSDKSSEESLSDWEGEIWKMNL